jgi:hypothetical protein
VGQRGEEAEHSRPQVDGEWTNSTSLVVVVKTTWQGPDKHGMTSAQIWQEQPDWQGWDAEHSRSQADGKWAGLTSLLTSMASSNVAKAARLAGMGHAFVTSMARMKCYRKADWQG